MRRRLIHRHTPTKIATPTKIVTPTKMTTASKAPTPPPTPTPSFKGLRSCREEGLTIPIIGRPFITTLATIPVTIQGPLRGEINAP